MIKIKNRTKPIPPGETIKELLRDRKISKKEFAFLMKNGYSVRLIYVKTEGKSAREGYLEVWKE